MPKTSIFCSRRGRPPASPVTQPPSSSPADEPGPRPGSVPPRAGPSRQGARPGPHVGAMSSTAAEGLSFGCGPSATAAAVELQQRLRPRRLRRAGRPPEGDVPLPTAGPAKTRSSPACRTSPDGMYEDPLWVRGLAAETVPFLVLEIRCPTIVGAQRGVCVILPIYAA